MSPLSAQISSLIDVRFKNFKTQFSQENSTSVEAAVKRANRNRYVFQSKGNEQQFEHAESVLEKLETAKDAVNSNAIAKTKSAIEEGIALVTKWMKIIMIADKSEYSWATVQEYLTDELASNSDDEKRLFRSEKRAERKVKESKKKRVRMSDRRFQPYPSSDRRDSADWRARFSRGGVRFARGQPVSHQIGPCFKISVCISFVLPRFVFMRLFLVDYSPIVCPVFS